MTIPPISNIKKYTFIVLAIGISFVVTKSVTTTFFYADSAYVNTKAVADTLQNNTLYTSLFQKPAKETLAGEIPVVQRRVVGENTEEITVRAKSGKLVTIQFPKGKPSIAAIQYIIETQ